jgi:glycosyltransferase involved in cell wall biosynthesis/O-antigen/teichoic acid export membrane protein
MTGDVPDEELAAAHGARWTTIATAIVGLLNYGYALMQTRLLNVTTYSIFAAGQGLIIWATAISNVTVPWLLVQGMVRARSDAEQETAVRFGMLASAASGAVAACVVGIVASQFGGSLMALVVSLSTLIIFLGTVTTGWLQSRQSMRSLSLLYIGENVLKNVAGLFLVIVGLREVGALAAFGIGGIVMLVRWPTLPRAAGRLWLAAAANRGLWHRALRIAVVQGMVSLLAVVDVVLVALLPVSHASAASYQVSATLSRVPLFIAGGVVTAFFPSLSHPAARGAIAARALQMYMTVAVPITVVVATMPVAVVGAVFPPQYGAMASFLRFTAMGGLAIGGVALVTAFFQAKDDYSCIPWLGAGLAGYVAVLLAGWRIGGIMGLAIGMALGAVATVALLGYRLVRREGRGIFARISVTELIATAGALILLRPHPVPWIVVATLTGLRACMRFLRPAGLRPQISTTRARPPGVGRIVISSFDSPGNPHYGGGGAAVVETIARWLAADYEVTVVTVANRGGVVVRDGIRYRQLPFGWAGPRGGQLLFHASLPVLARRTPHDVWIESFTPPFSTSFLPFFSGSPIVGFAQSLSGKQMWQRYRLPFFLIERFGLRFYRDVVVLNPADHALVLRCNPEASVRTIPNCIEVPHLPEERLGQGEHILFLGRIEVRQKGLDLLLAAYERSGLAMPLVIAGAGTRHEESRLAALLQAAPGDVHWVGHVTGRRKQRLLEDSAFVVLPSRHEAFGLAALEGMAWGKPVLHFDLPTLRWIDGDVCVASFDADALAAGMRTLARDEDIRRRLGQAARAAARDHGQAETAARYRTLVRQLLDPGGGGR